MTRPKALVRVEWKIARHPDRPNDRIEQSRNYTSREHAGSQVASIRLWEPKFAELLGVWECSGGSGELEWTPVDPDALPVGPEAGARFADFRRYWPDNPEWSRMGVLANEGD